MAALSPQVIVRETDLSFVAPSISTTITALVGGATKGPINDPQFVTTPQEYIEMFGEPTPLSYMSYAALLFLQRGNQLWVNRVASEKGLDAISYASTDVAATTTATLTDNNGNTISGPVSILNNKWLALRFDGDERTDDDGNKVKEVEIGFGTGNFTMSDIVAKINVALNAVRNSSKAPIGYATALGDNTLSLTSFLRGTDSNGYSSSIEILEPSSGRDDASANLGLTVGDIVVGSKSVITVHPLQSAAIFSSKPPIACDGTPAAGEAYGWKLAKARTVSSRAMWQYDGNSDAWEPTGWSFHGAASTVTLVDGGVGYVVGERVKIVSDLVDPSDYATIKITAIEAGSPSGVVTSFILESGGKAGYVASNSIARSTESMLSPGGSGLTVKVTGVSIPSLTLNVNDLGNVNINFDPVNDINATEFIAKINTSLVSAYSSSAYSSVATAVEGDDGLKWLVLTAPEWDAAGTFLKPNQKPSIKVIATRLTAPMSDPSVSPSVNAAIVPLYPTNTNLNGSNANGSIIGSIKTFSEDLDGSRLFTQTFDSGANAPFGSGYAIGDYVAITETASDITTWGGAIVRIGNVVDGSVATVSISGAGDNYSVGDVLKIDAGNGDARVIVTELVGSPAPASGPISAVQVQWGGSGYATDDDGVDLINVSTALNTAAGATIDVVTISNGVPSQLILVNGGIGRYDFPASTISSTSANGRYDKTLYKPTTALTVGGSGLKVGVQSFSASGVVGSDRTLTLNVNNVAELNVYFDNSKYPTMPIGSRLSNVTDGPTTSPGSNFWSVYEDLFEVTADNVTAFINGIFNLTTKYGVGYNNVVKSNNGGLLSLVTPLIGSSNTIKISESCLALGSPVQTGTDATGPGIITELTVTAIGTGYEVGDVLKVKSSYKATAGLEDWFGALVEVLTVDGNGGILTVDLLDGGYGGYWVDDVAASEYEEPDVSKVGIGATFTIDTVRINHGFSPTNSNEFARGVPPITYGIDEEKETITFKAVSPGSWASDKVKVYIVDEDPIGSPGYATNLSRVDIYYDTSLVESYRHVSMDPNESRTGIKYIENAIGNGNSSTQVSAFVTVDFDESSLNLDAYPNNNVYLKPTTAATQFVSNHTATDEPYILTGGEDGLTEMGSTELLGVAWDETLEKATGLEAFANEEKIFINIIACPDGAGNIPVINRLISLSEQRADVLALVDPPQGLSPKQVVDWHNAKGDWDGQFGALNSSYAALYGTWIEYFDSYNDQNIWLPPSCFMLPVIAYNDAVAQPWFAPAGLTRGIVRNAIRVEYSPTLGDRENMYGNANAVNPIVNFPQDGIIVWGQRTLQRQPSALDRINVRRMLLVAKTVVKLASRVILFEPNDVATRTRLVNIITPVLDSIKSKRGIQQFKVVDATTNRDIQLNQMALKIYVQPTQSVEIIDINFIITAAGVSVG